MPSYLLQCWTPYAVTYNLYSWRWAYRCPKHVEIFVTINHNCCIKLVPLVINITQWGTVDLQRNQWKNQKKKIETQHTLQNQKKTQQKRFAKEDNDTYSIPSNIKRENKKSHKSKNRLPGRRLTYCGCVQWNTVQTMKSKVVILGISHLMGSVPRIGNYLSAKFEVSGFNKPGAGFEKFMERQ